MPLIRPTALRSLQSGLRFTTARASLRAAAPARTQLVARRYASGGGHGGGHGEASSDLPWLLGALVITPPSCWYLWPDSSHAEHHDDHGHHEEHEEKGESEESEESGKPDEGDQAEEDQEAQEDSAPAEQEGGDEKGGEEEKPAEKKSEDKSEDKSEEKSDEGEDSKESSGDDSESKGDDESESKGDTGSDNPTATKAKANGRVKADSPGAEVTRKIEDSSKGGTKIRRDSGLGKNLGEGPAKEEHGEAQAQSKPPGGSQGDIGQKQKGMSNTDTRHSIAIDEPGSGKSTKASGGPETAKHKGTVDTSGPLK